MNSKPNPTETNDFYNERKNLILSSENPSSFYPHKFHFSTSLSSLLSTYDYLLPNESADVIHALAGRITSKRGHGKLFFFDLRVDSQSIQLLASTADVVLPPSLQRGDIVGAKGFPTRTKSGQFSLRLTELQLLAPCLHPLPTEHFALKDIEQRLRNRSLDLVANKEKHEIFRIRSKVLNFFRKCLLKKSFIEVETPVLAKIAGGAAAKPFETKLEALKMPLFLRIAPELYLKKLIIGGLEKVFEIGKCFRNEGIDATHNPEFTTLELYWAYADYRDGMQMVEEMISELVFKIKGSYKVEYTLSEKQKKTLKGLGKSNSIQIDFSRPWKKVYYLEEISKGTGLSIEDLANEALLIDAVKKAGLSVPEPATAAKLLDKLAGHFIEDSVLNPTFVLEHPQLMSPLAKYHRAKPGVTERFELFIAGFEFANAYTELNDPFVQRECFREQAKQKSAGDVEVPPTDEDFVQAMELGMPPTCGIGIGIDRLMMLLTDQQTIKEVIAFPMLKDE